MCWGCGAVYCEFWLFLVWRQFVCFQPPLVRCVLPVCVLCLWYRSACLLTCPGAVVQCAVSLGSFWFGDSLFSTTPSEACTACLCPLCVVLECKSSNLCWSCGAVYCEFGQFLVWRHFVFNHSQEGKRCLSLSSVYGVGVQIFQLVPELWFSVL